MNKLKYVLIGCGRVAPNHITAVLHNPDTITLAAVCDIDRSAAEALLKNSGLDGVPIYTDHRVMLDEIKPDMCAIATISGCHAEIARDCLNAGVHTLVEKPIALSVDDAKGLITLAEEKKLTLGVCFQNRFNKAVTAIREAIDAGRFGRLLYGAAQIRWGRNKSYYEQAAWRGTWKDDGGALMNQCIHDIDLLLWMMGSEPTEVFAYTDRLNHDYIEAEDLGLAVVKFKNGTYGLIEGTTNVFPRNLEETLCIFGETGTVKAGGKAVNTIENWILADNKDDVEQLKKECLETSESVYGFGHTPLYQNFISAVQNGTPLKATATDGLNALSIILAIYKSAATGAPAKLPIDKCATTDFEGRFK